jgi:cyclopentanol dehydrogenase
MGHVSGKVALVTGGSMGMGESHCKLLVREGANVIVTDVAVDAGEAVAEAIRDAGGEAMFLRHDVASEADWMAVVDKAVGTFGKIDILVNNAGIVIFKPNNETTTAEWDRVMSVNSTGVFLGCKHIVPAMEKAGGGSIVNISSISGMVGMVSQAAYQASKGAVRMLTKSCAVDYAQHNIRANSVHPGMVRTPGTRLVLEDEKFINMMRDKTILNRVAEPLELSCPVLFLASDESSFMTGSEVVVDGGYMAQ